LGGKEMDRWGGYGDKGGEKGIMKRRERKKGRERSSEKGRTGFWESEEREREREREL
jgi:hypothetical protein